MRVLVTGDRGYIGAVLAPTLAASGHAVRGLDSGLYDGCDFGAGHVHPRSLTADIRDVTVDDLADLDAVICLAALSNDPLGQLDPAITWDINLNGTCHLAETAKAAGIPRFVFASSCSLYGAAGSSSVGEDAAMHPITAYGRTKAAAEHALATLADDNFSPTFLRNATAFGVSPRLRLDIVVNNLVGVAMATGQVQLQSDGTPWRPLVHIEDISRAALAVLEAPREVIHNEAFNVGREDQNLQVRDVAELVAAAVPRSVVTFADGAGPDQRDYRVDFSKLTDTFPGLDLRWTVAAGVDQLAASYAASGMDLATFQSSRYVRLKRIEELMESGCIDSGLRRLQTCVTSDGMAAS